MNELKRIEDILNQGFNIDFAIKLIEKTNETTKENQEKKEQPK